MPLKIKRRTKARADQSDIWLYIANHSVSAADRQMDRLHDAFSMLAEYPDAGRMRVEFDARLRAFPVDQYIVFYWVTPNLIEIVRILHAARDITADLLAE